MRLLATTGWRLHDQSKVAPSSECLPSVGRASVEHAVFYCVVNMPGAVAATATQALTSATFDYALALADSGWEAACTNDRALAAGLSSAGGSLRHAAAVEAFPALPAA